MTDIETGIRSYGPGKFDTILDSYVYDVSLEGADDECGESDSFGWFGLMRNGRTIFKDHDPFLETLNEEEQETLENCAGVIVSEDSNGFVSVDYYDTDEELNKAWADIIEECAKYEEQDEENV